MVLLPEHVTKLQNVWPCDAVMEAQVAIFTSVKRPSGANKNTHEDKLCLRKSLNRRFLEPEGIMKCFFASVLNVPDWLLAKQGGPLF